MTTLWRAMLHNWIIPAVPRAIRSNVRPVRDSGSPVGRLLSMMKFHQTGGPSTPNHYHLESSSTYEKGYNGHYLISSQWIQFDMRRGDQILDSAKFVRFLRMNYTHKEGTAVEICFFVTRSNLGFENQKCNFSPFSPTITLSILGRPTRRVWYNFFWHRVHSIISNKNLVSKNYSRAERLFPYKTPSHLIYDQTVVHRHLSFLTVEYCRVRHMYPSPSQNSPSLSLTLAITSLH